MVRRLLPLSLLALLVGRLLACGSTFSEADTPAELDASPIDAARVEDVAVGEPPFDAAIDSDASVAPDAPIAEPPCVTGDVRTQTRTTPKVALSTGGLNATFGAIGANSSAPWVGAALAKASDDQWAQFSRPADAATESSFLVLKDFGFSVPPNAQVIGMAVNVERHATPAGPVSDNRVGVLKGGLVTNGFKFGMPDAAPTASDQQVTFGGPAYLWGDTWLGVDTNDVAFGVVYLAGFRQDGGPQESYVDGVSVTVTYECP